MSKVPPEVDCPSPPIELCRTQSSDAELIMLCERTARLEVQTNWSTSYSCSDLPLLPLPSAPSEEDPSLTSDVASERSDPLDLDLWGNQEDRGMRLARKSQLTPRLSFSVRPALPGTNPVPRGTGIVTPDPVIMEKSSPLGLLMEDEAPTKRARRS